MSKRLVKVVKELNVGMASIVEFLHKNGFDIDRKPMANVTDEMYDLLVKEFQASKDIKEKAEQMILNTKSFQSRQSKPLFDLDKDDEEDIVEEPPEQPKKADEKKDFIKAHLADSSKPKLKVLGKIDLDKSKKEKEVKEDPPVEDEIVEKAQKPEEKEIVQEEKTEDKKETETPVEKPQKKEEPKVKKSKKSKKEKESDKPEKVEDKEPVQEEKPEQEVDAVIRAKAPQLKGLKVLGKIDTKKFERKPKKVVEKASKNKAGKTAVVKKAGGEDPNAKRKRRRRKVQSKGFVSNRGGRRDLKKKDEVREISQKEIEEQIKLTMARLQGSGKDKRPPFP